MEQADRMARLVQAFRAESHLQEHNHKRGWERCPVCGAPDRAEKRAARSDRIYKAIKGDA